MLLRVTRKPSAQEQDRLRFVRLDAHVADVPIPLYGRENSGGHTGMELRRVGGTVLSQWNAAGRLPHDLRARVRHGGSRLDVLRDARRQDRAGWAQRTPDDFLFALKLPQEITHERRLRNIDDVAAEFFDRARELGPKLGPILIQLGPDFGPTELPAVAQFLPKLPRDIRFAIEFDSAVGFTTACSRCWPSTTWRSR